MRKTNPISAGAGRGEAPGAWDAGQICETNPIQPGRIRNGRGWPADPAGERLCETKPISARATGGVSALQKRSYGKAYMQEAPAKQSQFPGTARDGLRPGNHQRSCRSGVFRQTNPICGRRAGKTGAKAGTLDNATRGANVRNKAKFPAAPGGARPQGRGTRVKCAKRTQFGPAGARHRCEKDAKRTQFPVSRAAGGARLCKTAQFRGVKCAKRTQFGPGTQEWARAGGSTGEQLCETKPIWYNPAAVMASAWLLLRRRHA
jgi:hypothetical protein